MISIICTYLILGERHDTKEFFLDPEFFLDLDPLLLLDVDGDALDVQGEVLEPHGEFVLEHVAEDPRLLVGTISSIL